ncbi:MAG: MinD/ParA family protein [Intrasporangium sp.]|uniref:MinD/ParA family ATP-binding protein n=1 Tax=Intrasporangium sp. TaxID=1925024 RepID=UPI00264A3E45|nr:MinD/ParA family protein [Intrasporangium sp.]MDN5795041.1 MinD/ParA family protein [Intrasporangium sp.]
MSVGHDLTRTDEPLGWGRAAGLDLLGEVQDSGLAKTTYLARRSDGQVVQLSELLHLVLAELDPARSPAAVASAVSDAFGRRLTTEGLAHLLETRLVPLGLVVPQLTPGFDPDRGHLEQQERPPLHAIPHTEVPAPTARPLLSLSLRGTLLPTRWVRRFARVLAPLYYPPLVLGALVCALVVDIGLFRHANLLGALGQVIGSPTLLLALYITLNLGALIHELGHAAACSYGGGRPGAIGIGIYLLVPAFYTDVTDSYRLSRSARIRTDLGGLYFNVWCIIALGALYRLTGEGVFVLAVFVMHIQMLQQLVPAIRLDGYYVLADVAGVPDLFARVGPVLRSLRPGTPPDPRVAELRPGARRIVVAWVVFVVPTLVLAMGWLVWSLPVIVSQMVAGLHSQLISMRGAWTDGDAVLVIIGVISLVLLIVPLLGMGVLLLRIIQMIGKRVFHSALRHYAPHSTRRPKNQTTRRPKEAPKEQLHTPTGITMATADTQSRSTQAAQDDYVLHEIWGRAPTPEAPPGIHVAALPAPVTAPTAQAAPPRAPSPAAYAEVARTVTLPPVASPARKGDRLSADAFSDELILPTRAPVPHRGWRRAVLRASGGAVNPGPGPAERQRAELEERLRQPIEGSRRVVVMSRKGGVGKTTTTLALGITFSGLRGDRVVAVDANPDAGNLAHRVAVPNERTITDVLGDLERIDTYAKLRAYTSQAPDSRLEVLASDDDPRIGMALDRTDYHRLIGLLDRFYNLILLDTGTGILDSANQGLLGEADQLVIVLRPGIDGGRAAALTLDWLDEHDYGPLVSRAVVVVNAVRPGVGAPLDAMVAHFEQRCARVVIVPWDPALETGSQTHLSDLAPATRQSFVELGAAVADGFRETGVRQ